MSSKTEKQSAWQAAGVLAISALLHIALLFLPLPGSREDAAIKQPSNIRVELVGRTYSSPVSEQVSPPPEPTGLTPVEPTEPVRPTAAEPASLDVAPSSDPVSEPASPTPAPQTASSVIQTQLLGAARTLGRASERPQEGRTLTYQGVPDLPSRPGWLHQHTGRVSASIDRWRGNDGSSNARIVTGTGQVVCVQSRAATIAETFNPWMSSAVPMMSNCGRQRPPKSELSDPWLRNL